MPDIVYRPAIRSDAASLADLIHRAMGDDADNAHLAAVLAIPSHFTRLAVVDDALIGFVDGFLTQSPEATWRFELDLLAVDEAWRGCGVGAELVRSILESAEQTPATMIRALVRAGNMPMETLMSRAEFKAESALYELWVKSVGALGPQLPHPPDDVQAGVVPVTTLTYRGVWLEGDINELLIAKALSHALRDRAEIVGATVPDDSPFRHTLQHMAFDMAGVYRWWHRSCKRGL